MLIKVRVSLPPSGYSILRDFLVTSLVYLSTFSDAKIMFESNTRVVLAFYGTSSLIKGVKHLITYVMSNISQGLLPIRITGNDKRWVFSKIFEKEFKLNIPANVKELELIRKSLQEYMRMMLNDPQSFIKSFEYELNEFDLKKGYNVKEGYPPLALFKSEFMEYARGLGAKLSETSKISKKLRLGIHSTMLGLIGACVSVMYRDIEKGITYYVVFDERYLEFAYHYLNYTTTLTILHRNFVSTIRLRRELLRGSTYLLYLALKMPRLPAKILGVLESENRVDAFYAGSIAMLPYRLIEFVTLLYSTDEGIILAHKLDRLLLEACSGREEAERFSDRIIKLSEGILFALSLIDQDISEAYMCLNDVIRDVFFDPDFQKFLRSKGLEFTSFDFEVLRETLDKLYYLVRTG